MEWNRRSSAPMMYAVEYLPGAFSKNPLLLDHRSYPCNRSVFIVDALCSAASGLSPGVEMPFLLPSTSLTSGSFETRQSSKYGHRGHRQPHQTLCGTSPTMCLEPFAPRNVHDSTTSQIECLLRTKSVESTRHTPPATSGVSSEEES